eukprot:CAMPEP_0171316760 /NCGR_PEP_ID=MMETSP0816-20121228/75699_1 /TAXON_ID=420281 /ORGANISM="Proboscia inermis, Strain CCAP1064/1" /LENGTH=423 /DNA_ID=CAMNT_0011809229 /DNA_START=144 /DNA_END=1416 /DNA_ORIENTATION=+
MPFIPNEKTDWSNFESFAVIATLVIILAFGANLWLYGREIQYPIIRSEVSKGGVVDEDSVRLYEVHASTVELLRQWQFPDDCQAPSRLFMRADNYTRAGFGSGMYFYRACLSLAMDQGRVLIGEEPMFRDLLHPWSSCTMEDVWNVSAQRELSTDASCSVPPCPPPVLVDCRWGKGSNMIWDSAENNYLRPPRLFNGTNFLWWAVHSTGVLFNPTESAYALINNVSEPFAAFHVRRGDKLLLEASSIHLKHYLSALDGVGVYRGTKNVVQVVTDDPEQLKEEAKEPSVSELNFSITFPSDATDRNWIPGSKRDLLMDTLILLRGEPAILDIRSNLSFLVLFRKLFDALDSGRPTTIVTMARNTFYQVLVRVDPFDASPFGVELFNKYCPVMMAGMAYEQQQALNGLCTGKPLTISVPAKAPSF